MANRAIYEQFRNTPEGQALLATLRYAEGTKGPKSYTTLFGGGQFSDLSRHPRKVVNTPNYSSAAAGAYQFMPGTWEEVSKALNLTDFSPTSQDIGALYKARQRLLPLGGLEYIKQKGLTKEALNALAPEWASLPTMSGRSYYGQPVKTVAELQKEFSASRKAPSGQPASTAGPPVAGTSQQTNASRAQNPDLFRNIMRAVQGMFGTAAPRQSSISDAYFDAAMAADASGDLDTATQLYSMALDSDMVPRGRSSSADLLSSMLPAVVQTYLDASAPVAAASTGSQPAPAATQPQAPGGSVGKLGSVIDYRKDIYSTSGDHLDVRVIKEGKYVDPETWRTGLTQLYVGGKPLYQQKGEQFARSYNISSPFGPRTTNIEGASTNHLGIDIPVAAGTSLEWRGPGKRVLGPGYIDVDTTDAQGRQFTVRLLHTTPG